MIIAKDDGKTNFNAKENNENTEETKLEKPRKDNEQSNTSSEKSKKDNEQSNPEGGVKNNDSGENLGGQRSENSNEKPFSNENDKKQILKMLKRNAMKAPLGLKGISSDGQVKKPSSNEVFPSGVQSESSDGQVQNTRMKFSHLSVPDIAWGKRSHVILDVGCGVASFGGYLFERNVLTMSLAPKDKHEAQQYAVGKLLLELNRLLRPGGFFVWSATRVYRRKGENVEIWKAMIEQTKSMCWEFLNKTKMEPVNKMAIETFRKPKSNDCYEQRSQQEPPLCPESDDPNAAWNVSLQTCMHKVPVDTSERGSKWPDQWPERLEKPPYWLSSSQVGVYGKAAPEDFTADTLKDKNLWVMNVVPIDSPDILPIIYERANVSRILKKLTPSNGKISKEAKETIQECVSALISFFTGEASDKCQREKRKTINGDDIIWAISTLGFEEYVGPLKLSLSKYRDIEGEKVVFPKQQKPELQKQQNLRQQPSGYEQNLDFTSTTSALPSSGTLAELRAYKLPNTILNQNAHNNKRYIVQLRSRTSKACKRRDTKNGKQVRGLIFGNGNISQEAATSGDGEDKQNASYGPYARPANSLIKLSFGEIYKRIEIHHSHLTPSNARSGKMAGLFDKQADLYSDARPTYPSDWYSMLAACTPRHSLAWDVGTGSGQAAIGVADHYDRVIGIDVSESQLQRRKLGRFNHRGPTAQAIHWFDLPKFYSLVTRLLRRPGGVLAVWCYNDVVVSPTFDPVMKRFHDTTLPYWNPRIQYLFDGYKTLPFPFESVGLGSEGEPLALDIPKKLSFEGFLRMLRSWSAVVTAKDKGVDLLSENVVKDFESAWGGSHLVRSIAYKAFMLAGKVKL
ncbi:putative methyltransferase PMT26 [Hibiscus syriacus]|uniref:Methyltransferase PMT26 n=1 Tax=Hibiscus syriacus TaxID=106335 RepID=A0A6A2ZRF6_HIBSY|nr:putative methyltransferase PMT26 [Hibiscus syriacus]